jgi:hypothetical protein
MFRSLRLIYLLRKIDWLAFVKRAKIRIKIIGQPGFISVRTSGSDIIVKEYYSVPIFLDRKTRKCDPLRIAIHEARHRVQHNYPKMRLLTAKDENFPESFKKFLRANFHPELAEKATPREIDAQIFDQLAYPVICANNTKGFLRLLFRGTEI